MGEPGLRFASCELQQSGWVPVAVVQTRLRSRRHVMKHRWSSRAARTYYALPGVLLCLVQPCQSQEAIPAPKASAAEVLAGEYTHSETELAAAIRLNADGTFLYGLTVGALDEHGQGRWKVVGDRVEFTSEPKPVPPTIIAGQISESPGTGFALRVLTSSGQDMPGVDLKIEFDTGEPVYSYLAGQPWSLPADEHRTPRFVTFTMPAYRLRSARLSLDARAGTIANFVLIPNDFGMVDLTGAYALAKGEKLTLHRPEGTMEFSRVTLGSDPR